MRVLSVVRFVASFLGLVPAVAAAQTWDLQGATEAISGTPFDQSGTAALVISGTDLYYCDYNPLSPQASFVAASVAELYRYPVTWHTPETAVYFGDDPSASPTGDKFFVTASVSAVAHQINGVYYQGYAVGLVTTYAFTSGSESGSMQIFEPGAFATDAASAKQLANALATGEPGRLPSFEFTGEPSCAEQCLNDYNTKKKNALDRFHTNMKVYCGVLGIPGGFIGGCGIGTALCGWAAPPFSTAFCCLAGGIIGSGIGFGGCAYAYYEIYQSELRQARNEYVNCMANCGYTIVEM